MVSSLLGTEKKQFPLVYFLHLLEIPEEKNELKWVVNMEVDILVDYPD